MFCAALNTHFLIKRRVSGGLSIFKSKYEVRIFECLLLIYYHKFDYNIFPSQSLSNKNSLYVLIALFIPILFSFFHFPINYSLETDKNQSSPNPVPPFLFLRQIHKTTPNRKRGVCLQCRCAQRDTVELIEEEESYYTQRNNYAYSNRAWLILLALYWRESAFGVLFVVVGALGYKIFIVCLIT